MANNKKSATKRENKTMKAIVHKQDDSMAAIRTFSEKRAAMAIGYIRDCSAAEIRCLRHELYSETASA